MEISQGPHYLDDTLTFTVVTHRFDTGALTDADSVPSYRIYEDETGTAILTGSMAKLDDTNTTGFYSEQITLSAANGFEAGKSYSIYVSAAVNSVTGGATGSFKMSSRDLLGIIDIGTAQGATGTTLQLRSAAAFADDELNGATVVITGGSAGVGQRRIITDYVGSTDTATVPTWTTTPTGTITYIIFASAPAEGVAQTGDAFAIVNHGTYGNAAIETALSAVATNVSTLIGRITSTLFSGITSLASWMGALAGKTADTSTRAEINATTSGAGYNETTDSQEALRDRGDAAWITATGFSTHSAADVWAVGTRTLTAFSFAVDISAAAVSLIWDKATSALTTVGSIGKLLVDNINATISSRLASSSYAAPLDAAGTRSAVGLASANLDTQLSGISGVTDKLDDTLEDDGGTFRFTTNALEQAPTGGSAPSAATIADAVWDELLSGHAGAGSAGEALSAAGTAGDPWTTALPGAYGAGTAGKIIGDNLNATVGSRATQTSVDDLPTNAELTTALASADDAVLTAIAALNNLSQANVRTAVGLASANLDTQLAAIDDFLDTEIAAIKAKTDNLPSDPADASDIAASFATVASSLATIAGYLDTEIAAIKAKTDNLPNDPADESSVQAGIVAAQVAVTAAISALNNLSAAQVNAEADAALADIGATSARLAKLDALPVRLRKNTAFANFQFLMVDEADHRTGKEGLTVTAQRVLDNGSIALCANSVVEIGSGLYRLDLAAADVNANIVTLIFSATGADTRHVTIPLQEAA